MIMRSVLVLHLIMYGIQPSVLYTPARTRGHGNEQSTAEGNIDTWNSSPSMGAYGFAPPVLLWLTDMKRAFSKASDALETNSRINTSLSWYKELATMSKICLGWPRVSVTGKQSGTGSNRAPGSNRVIILPVWQDPCASIGSSFRGRIYP